MPPKRTLQEKLNALRDELAVPTDTYLIEEGDAGAAKIAMIVQALIEIECCLDHEAACTLARNALTKLRIRS